MTGKGPRLWAGLALAALCVGGRDAAAGTVTINKAKMADKTNAVEVTEGYADAALSVDFKGDASCTCDAPNIEYTWSFGDATTAVGANVSHTYGAGGAGNKAPSLYCKCKNCNADKTSAFLSVYAIRGIQVTKIGDDVNPAAGAGKLCFDAKRAVEGKALPAGVNGSDKIDWYIPVLPSQLDNTASGSMPSPAPWPMTNNSWGSQDLYVTIDSTVRPGQNGELNLTGTPSYINANQKAKLFFDEAGPQNPGVPAVPNWFYYWKQTGAYAGTMTYSAAAGTGYTDFVGGAWTCYVGPGSNGTAGGGCWGGASGIDFFANICRHENQHKTDLTAHWGAGAGRVAASDLDGDYLNDAKEAPAYDPTKAATHLDTFGYNNPAGGPLRDCEHLALSGQPAWAAGTANASDWAHPGKQWP
jgi:hypothetical protein